MDGQNGPGFSYMWTEVLRNAVTRKSLTYQQQYDGNSTPVTETWNYDIALGTIVMPDGGVVTQLGQPTFRTENADGTINEKLWQANRPQGFPTTSAYDPVSGIDAYDPLRANHYVKTLCPKSQECDWDRVSTTCDSGWVRSPHAGWCYQRKVFAVLI